MSSTTHIKKDEAGFTLVELAIVMIIIGLLITGVLKGQQMIENARTTASISQIKAIDAATSTFLDMYGALPGDISSPGVRLPGCTGTCAGSASNGDGSVGATTGLGTAITAASGNDERILFFSHLATADFISGVDIAPPATNAIGTSVPEFSLGGGLVVGRTTGAATALPTGAAAATAGHYLAIVPGFAVLAAGNTNALTPAEAARIDTKLDDSLPNTGQVRGVGSAGATGAANCVSAATAAGLYNGADQSSNCGLYIRIQG